MGTEKEAPVEEKDARMQLTLPRPKEQQFTREVPLAPLDELEVQKGAKRVGVTPEQVRGGYRFSKQYPDMSLSSPLREAVAHVSEKSIPLPGDATREESAFVGIVHGPGGKAEVVGLAEKLGVSGEEARSLLLEAGKYLRKPSSAKEPPQPK